MFCQNNVTSSVCLAIFHSDWFFEFDRSDQRTQQGKNRTGISHPGSKISFDICRPNYDIHNIHYGKCWLYYLILNGNNMIAKVLDYNMTTILTAQQLRLII